MYAFNFYLYIFYRRLIPKYDEITNQTIQVNCAYPAEKLNRIKGAFTRNNTNTKIMNLSKSKNNQLRKLV